MKKQVKENGKYIAPSWCRDICINHGRPGCIYDCAPERKARYFVIDPDITIHDMSPFPVRDFRTNSTRHEKYVMIGEYFAKFLEDYTGVPQDPERDRLKKELEAASDERLLEIVGEVLDGSGVVYEAEK